MNRLDQILDSDRVSKLKAYAITDVPDLVGALEVDHASIGKLLDLAPSSVDKLHERALNVLSPDERAAVHDLAHDVGYGAWDPNSE